MKLNIKPLVEAMRNLFAKASELKPKQFTSSVASAVPRISPRKLVFLGTMAVIGSGAYWLVKNPPTAVIERGHVGLRVNQVTGELSQWKEGGVFVLPGLHQINIYNLRDQVYEPDQIKSASGTSPLQSIEGLSLGVDLSVRYAIDATRITAVYKNLPENIDADIVAPAVQGSLYRIFARYTVREIFSTKRSEIQKLLEAEITTKLNADGILLRSVQIGKVDLPADYKRGMESLLAEELASEKMRYTIELKEKKVKETKIDAETEKMQRELRAETAASEQVIAAKGQAEAMKHVLPLKQKQVEQRQLEAEAEKASRIKIAEANAQSRRIEAHGEAEARQKLADAEVYRLDKVGRTNSEQMEREGVLVSKHPLLIQKTLADKLSDKIQVIIAPLSKSGGFLGDSLLGTGKRQVAATQKEVVNTEVQNEKEGE